MSTHGSGSARSGLVKIITTGMSLRAAIAVSWSMTSALGAGSANEITIASRSRLATGGRCKVFFLGAMAVMLPQPGSVGSNRHRSPTSRVVASLRKMPRPRHSVFVPSSLMTV